MNYFDSLLLTVGALLIPVSAMAETPQTGLRPGDTGYVFPPGVSLNGGFVDVDKVKDLTRYGYTGTDEELCWACSTAGMIQWWLNDYREATGHPYPLRIALPAESKCYSTPVMDVLAQAFYHDAGRPDYVFQWFFMGMPNSVASYTLNGHPAFNSAYTYVQGNFADMPKEDYGKYISKELNSYYLYSGLSESEERVKASADIMGWLYDGPVYLSINRGNHALSCWGVKYTVDKNSNPIITRIYYAENDLMAANIKGGLNESGITWKEGDGPHMTSTDGNNVEINSFLPIKAYSRVNPDVTSITPVIAPSASVPSSEAIFDLTGRRVTNPAPGLYIINGRKVLIK